MKWESNLHTNFFFLTWDEAFFYFLFVSKTLPNNNRLPSQRYCSWWHFRHWVDVSHKYPTQNQQNAILFCSSSINFGGVIDVRCKVNAYMCVDIFFFFWLCWSELRSWWNRTLIKPCPKNPGSVDANVANPKAQIVLAISLPFLGRFFFFFFGFDYEKPAV